MARTSSKRPRPTVSPATPAPGPSARLLGASHVLLLCALSITPLVVDDWWFLKLERGAFEAGSQLGQAFTGQTLVMMAAACAAVALALGARALRWHASMRWAVALLGWAVVATAASPGPWSAVLGYPPNSQGLLAQMVYFAAFVLAVSLANSEQRIRRTVRALALTGGAVSAIGVLQTVGFDPVGALTPWSVLRSSGTLGNPDMMGGFVVFTLFAALGSALTEEALRWRVPAWISAGLCAAAGVTTYSRAAWLGVVVGAALLAALAWRLRLRVDKKVASTVLAVLLVTAIAVTVRPTARGASTNVGDRLTTAVSVTDPNSAARLNMWRTLLVAVARRPLTGYGPESLTLTTQPLWTPDSPPVESPGLVWGSVHSIPLQMLGDLGVPGFLLWVGAFAAVAVVSLRTISDPAVGSSRARVLLACLWCGVAAYLADSLFTPSSFVGALYVWCALGLLIAPSAAAATAGSASLRRTLAAGAALVAIAGALMGVSFLAADAQASVAYDKRLTPARRIAAADIAVALNPLSPRYAVIDASALGDRAEELAVAGGSRSEVSALFDRALSQAERAVAIEPSIASARAFLASVLLVGADRVDERFRARAVTEAEAAARMAPYDLAVQDTYARVLRTVDPDRARVVLRRILEMRAGYSPAAIRLSEIDLAAGDKSAALGVLRAALAAATDPVDRADLEQALASIP